MMAFEQYGIYNISKLSEQIKSACDFQTLLMIQTEAESGPAATGGKLDMQVVSNSFAGPFHTFSMSLDVVIAADKCRVTIEYDANLIAAEEIERLSAQLQQVFELLHDPALADTKLSDLDFVSSGDIAQLALWNTTPPAPQDDLVHATFQRRASLQPDAPAVRSWEGELTYAQLDIQSSAIVPELIERGILPGMKVPLLFEKSIYTVVTMLALLKAGATCVSLDPAHPLERLQGLVKDVDATLVLSSRRWSEKALMQHSFSLPPAVQVSLREFLSATRRSPAVLSDMVRLCAMAAPVLAIYNSLHTPPTLALARFLHPSPSAHVFASHPMPSA